MVTVVIDSDSGALLLLIAPLSQKGRETEFSLYLNSMKGVLSTGVHADQVFGLLKLTLLLCTRFY